MSKSPETGLRAAIVAIKNGGHAEFAIQVSSGMDVAYFKQGIRTAIEGAIAATVVIEDVPTCGGNESIRVRVRKSTSDSGEI